MQLTNVLAAALIAFRLVNSLDDCHIEVLTNFSGFAAAMPTANADIAAINNVADPPRGYGNDHRGNDNRGGREADTRFCDKYTHGRKEEECRREFKECDKQYNGRRERECREDVERKFEPHNRNHY